MNVAELEIALRNAKEQEKQAGNAAWEDLQARAEGQFDWDVKWFDKYTVSVFARYKQPFLDEMAALDKKHLSSIRRIHDSARDWHGMTYLLVGNVLIQSGGGWCVLDIPHQNSFRSWRELTDEESACLHAGIVPESIKTPTRRA